MAMEEARRRLAALHELPPIEAPESLVRAAEAKIADLRRRRRTGVRVAWLAAAILLIPFAGLHIYYLTLSPSPYDLRILGQSALVADTGGSLRVLLVDHDSGRPVEGARSKSNWPIARRIARFTWPVSRRTNGEVAALASGCRIGNRASTSCESRPILAAAARASSAR